MKTGFFEKAQAVQANNENIAITENGAVGYRTTGRSLMDLNFSVPQMRDMDPTEIIQRWEKAYNECPELAMRWLFFLRDVRGGLGERRTFRIILDWMCDNYPAEIRKLIGAENMFTHWVGELIPFYGRWDDFIQLTKKENVSRKVYTSIAKQLDKDVQDMHNYQSVSLMAKWLPSLTTSKKTNREARRLCKKIGILETPYRKKVSALREYLRVTEVQMSHRQWDRIDYSAVPSRAAKLYMKAFNKHDPERYQQYISAVNKGEVKINAQTLFPHEIVYQIKNCSFGDQIQMQTLEGLWKNLPDIVPAGGNTIVVRDGSGSMMDRVSKDSGVRAMDVGDALSIYFAERLSGEFHNKIITFSEQPKFIQFTEDHDTLNKKVNHLQQYTEVANTNVEAVFNLILQTALRYNMSQEEIPANILIISDMEFDRCAVGNDGWSGNGSISPHLFEVIQARYRNYGYKLPRVIFWNVNSRSGAIPMTENELGVCLVSGFSTNLAKMVMSNKTDPWECLVDQLENARYDPISLALGYTRTEDYI